MKVIELKTSEEAVAYGKNATPVQIEVLQKLRCDYIIKARRLKESDSTDDLQKALIYATKGQFMREALQAAEAHVPFHNNK